MKIFKDRSPNAKTKNEVFSQTDVNSNFRTTRRKKETMSKKYSEYYPNKIATDNKFEKHLKDDSSNDD